MTLTVEITCHPNRKHTPEVMILFQQAIMAVVIDFAVPNTKEVPWKLAVTCEMLAKESQFYCDFLDHLS